WDWGPSWSMDGSRIVFQSSRDGNSEIYIMNANGSFQQRLTNDPEWDLHPIWGTRSWMPPL
ncbi:PD40 domain-containing protein, partial [Candidatus Bipolaricaulota bacterium]|nr:PD40 domain-containing protein [Candidatus Bipolaricaulota bacterium]